jgi:hypothetical protein
MESSIQFDPTRVSRISDEESVALLQHFTLEELQAVFGMATNKAADPNG